MLGEPALELGELVSKLVEIGLCRAPKSSLLQVALNHT
jgi:hypothetical protein